MDAGLLAGKFATQTVQKFVSRMSAGRTIEWQASANRFSRFVPNKRAVGFFEENRAHDEGEQRNADGEKKSGVDIAGSRRQAHPDEREQATENPVSDVVRQGDGGIANFGWE